MENNEKLNIGIGSKETTSLKPGKVMIAKVSIESVGKEGFKNDKVVCAVKHPDKEEMINLSAVKFERNGQLKHSGMWYKLDEDGKLQKGSATTCMLEFLKVSNLLELEGKEIETALDDNGYLVFKAY